jgi:hypothetical protein
MVEAEVVVAQTDCACGVPASVPARAAAQASVLTVEARSTRGSVSLKSGGDDRAQQGKTKMSDLASEFRQRAEMCLRNAETATHERDKTDWLKLAEEWLRLADEVDPSPEKS